MSVNLNIKKIREKKGISRGKMADMLGITLNGYGKIERGEVDITITRLYQLSEIFGLSIIDFFDERDCIYGLMAETHATNIGRFRQQQPLGDDFDNQMYIEFLEQRIAWLKAQLASQTANEVES